VNNRFQTCPSCTWTNAGINADGDAQDKECGDSLCDDSAGVYDATKAATETSCTDSLDNDCNGKTDCADPACNGQGSCCTTISRNCKQLTQDQFKQLFRKCYFDNNEAECLRIQDRISNSNFYACPNNPSDSLCCTNPSSCVFNSVCYADGAAITLPGDDIRMICKAHSPGQWIPEFEIDCTNNVDDDLDGLTDCADADCNGSLTGTVKNQNGQTLSLIDVAAKKDLTTVESTVTSQSGSYSMSLNCGDYNIVASSSNYAPQIKFAFVPPFTAKSANFSLSIGTSCESDCTFSSDNIVHASCDGKNGCAFYDSISKAACDDSQTGWVRDYNETHYVTCAPGSPQKKVEVQASLSCSSGTLVKVTRIVVYNGKPVKLVVATCG